MENNGRTDQMQCKKHNELITLISSSINNNIRLQEYLYSENAVRAEVFIFGHNPIMRAAPIFQWIIVILSPFFSPIRSKLWWMWCQ